MATGTDSMRIKALVEMTRVELEEIAVKLRLQFKEEDNDEELINIIRKSGKYSTATEKTGASVKKLEDGTRVHPTLGKYVKVVVHPTQSAQQNTSIFASIGLYTIEFQPNDEVSVPTKIAKLLKDASAPEYYFDPRALSENGNMGAHMTRDVPKYIVQAVSDQF